MWKEWKGKKRNRRTSREGRQEQGAGSREGKGRVMRWKCSVVVGSVLPGVAAADAGIGVEESRVSTGFARVPCAAYSKALGGLGRH